jgi:hypothetical protein
MIADERLANVRSTGSARREKAIDLLRADLGRGWKVDLTRLCQVPRRTLF